MVLGKRERTLAMLAGGLVLLLAGHMAWSAATAPIRDRQSRVDTLEQQVKKKEQRFRKLQQARARLMDWNRRSLPTEVQTGRLLYENWLLKIVERANFARKRVESAESRPHRGLFVTFPYTIHGQCGLEQLTKFLFEFYSAGHLHQIRRLNIRPAERPPGYEVVLAVEAAALPTADRKDKLSETASHSLGKTDLAQYQAAIAQRNVFAPYTPTRAATSAVDPARFVFVTGITEKDGKPQVWLRARISGEKFTLAEGEQFRAGGIQGTVKRIGQRDVELEIDGKSRVVPLGESLQPRESAPRM